MQHGDHHRRGCDPHRPGHAVDHVGHDLRRRVQAPVAGPLHRVVEAGVVERGQLHLRGQIEQPDLDGAVDLRLQPRLGPARRRLQARARRRCRRDQDQRRDRGADTLRGGTRREQRLQHAGRGQQGESGEHSRNQVQRDRRHQVPAARVVAEPHRLGDDVRELPRHRQEAGRGHPLVIGPPVRGCQLSRGLVGIRLLRRCRTGPTGGDPHRNPLPPARTAAPASCPCAQHQYGNPAWLVASEISGWHAGRSDRS